MPRHTQVQRVRSYIRAPRVAAKTAGVAKLAAPLIRLTGHIGGGPDEARRAKTRFVVVAEAHGPNGSRRVVLRGSDVYGLTALLVARGAEALRDGAARGSGALAPAEAFDAWALVEKLAPLLELDAVEDV